MSNKTSEAIENLPKWCDSMRMICRHSNEIKEKEILGIVKKYKKMEEALRVYKEYHAMIDSKTNIAKMALDFDPLA